MEIQRLKSEVEEAADRIAGYIRETPLERSTRFSNTTRADVLFKLENLQYTGSFKVRGATNKMLSLPQAELKSGIIAASSGNHGLAVARTAALLGAPCTVLVPEDASHTKVQAIREYRADVVFAGTDAAVTEGQARQRALDYGLTYVSPYNDPEIVAGQGTIAAEMLDQARRSGERPVGPVGLVDPVDVADVPDAVFVPVGGGGMISGIAGYLRATFGESVKVYGCQPENSAVMYESVEAGNVLELSSKPTLSDGTAGGVEPGAVTFDLCREHVHEWVLVSEEEIKQAIRTFMDAHHMMIEGAAGVSVAALLKSREKLEGLAVAVVVCGANISLGDLSGVIG